MIAGEAVSPTLLVRPSGTRLGPTSPRSMSPGVARARPDPRAASSQQWAKWASLMSRRSRPKTLGGLAQVMLL